MSAGVQPRAAVIIEIISAMMMSVVAVATAWSGYQSARWSGVQASCYAAASAKRVQSSVAAISSGQAGLLDVLLFNDWLTATLSGNTKQAALDERRFRPQFVPVFQAWIALDPLNNTAAPASPILMPQYHQMNDAVAAQKDAEAEALFATGQAANQQSDDYILTTVLLAAGLFFIALSQRFENIKIKVYLDLFAFFMLVAALYRLWIFPVQ